MSALSVDAHLAAEGTAMRRRSAKLSRVAQVTGFVLHVALIAHVWDQPAVRWACFASLIAANLFNARLMPLLMPRLGNTRTEDLRLVFNVGFLFVSLYQTNFDAYGWVFVPFISAVSNVAAGRHPWHRPAVMLTAMGLGGVIYGSPLMPMLLALACGVFIQAMINAHVALVQSLLDERTKTLADLQAAQQTAIAQEKMASIGMLAAGVAHEINNPMCFVTANVEALLYDLQQEPVLSTQVAEYRDTILPETIDGIARVNAIVADLRRFARGEPERPVPFDLSTEVQAALRISRAQLAPDQKLHAELAPVLPLVGQPRQIGQVTLNLIINALQALGDAGDVWVRTEQRADGAVLTVRDNGAGMSAEVQQKLFQPFFTTKPAGKGTGLGLPVVHGIVKAHGGRIDVRSEPGKGTQFEVFFPAARAA